MLSHYSPVRDKIFSHLFPAPADNEHKPGGLWLSDDTDYGWLAFVSEQLRRGSSDWADGEELIRWKYDFIIDPGDVGRILVLTTHEDFISFTSNYREASPRGCVVDGRAGYGVHIEWGRVKSDYKGILITPFQRDLSRRDPEYHWYRFDCASGCFWDTTCLVQIREPLQRAGGVLRPLDSGLQTSDDG